jgi:hypothetical protein
MALNDAPDNVIQFRPNNVISAASHPRFRVDIPFVPS